MASLRRDPEFGSLFVRFRHSGCSFNRSLKTPHENEAQAIRGRIEEAILLLERGRIEMPSDADPARFILSDGKLDRKSTKPRVGMLADLFQIYDDELPEGAKDADTLKGERGHQDLILKHLRGTTSIQTVTTSTMQRYVELR